MSCSSASSSPSYTSTLPPDFISSLHTNFVQTNVGLDGNAETYEYPVVLILAKIAQTYKISHRMEVIELILFHLYQLLQSSSTKPYQKKILSNFIQLSFQMMYSLKCYEVAGKKFPRVLPSCLENVQSTTAKFLGLMGEVERKYTQTDALKEAIFILHRLVLDEKAHERVFILHQLACPTAFYPSHLRQNYPLKVVFNDLKSYYVFQLRLIPASTDVAKKYHKLLSTVEFKDFFTSCDSSVRRACIKCSSLAAKCLQLKSEEACSKELITSLESVGVDMLVLGSLETLEECLNAQTNYSHQVSFKRFFKYVAQFPSIQEEMKFPQNILFRQLEEDLLRASQYVSEFIKEFYIRHLNLYQENLSRSLELQKSLIPHLKEEKIAALRAYLYEFREEANRILDELKLDLRKMRDHFIETIATAEVAMTENEIQSTLEEMTTNLAFYLTIIMDARRICGDDFAVENIDQYIYPQEFLDLLSINYGKYIRPLPPKVFGPQEDLPPEKRAEEVSSQENKELTEESLSEEVEVETDPSILQEEEKSFLGWQETLEGHFPGITTATDEAKLLKLINKRFTLVKRAGSHKGGSHRLYRDNETGKTVLLAAHNSTELIKRGTLHKIRKSLRQTVIHELIEKIDHLTEVKEKNLSTLEALLRSPKKQNDKRKHDTKTLREAIEATNLEIQEMQAKIDALS